MAVTGFVRGLTTLSSRVKRTVIQHPNLLWAAGSVVTLLVVGAMLRFHFSSFLDPFEDGYQNWWISANLLSTGTYWDRHSMMTQGNWLPLYHLWGAMVLAASGPHGIEGLKIANIGLSAATAVAVFFAGRKEHILVGFAAMAFYQFNFIDVIVSGWATAEALVTFLVFLAYLALFSSGTPKRRNLSIASIALTLAVLTRYEAWLLAALLVLFGVVRSSGEPSKSRILWAVAPALVAMLLYFLYATQWGFLPQIIVTQTSTDLRYQVTVGTQPNPLTILTAWWQGYLSYFPLVVLPGAALAFLHLRKDIVPWLLAGLWGFIVAYTILQFGNPSYRYVVLTIPFLSVYAARAIRKGIGRIPARGTSVENTRPRVLAIAFASATVLIAATMLPPALTFWQTGFASSQYMEPLRNAGQFVATLPLPPGMLLISESSIAAYYSGYPPDRILGARWLPDNVGEALSFLKQNAAYVVYMGVPYYSLRTLFPYLQNGTDTPDFQLLFDAGGQSFGTHAIYVYRVVPS